MRKNNGEYNAAHADTGRKAGGAYGQSGIKGSSLLLTLYFSHYDAIAASAFGLLAMTGGRFR